MTYRFSCYVNEMLLFSCNKKIREILAKQYVATLSAGLWVFEERERVRERERERD